MVYNYLTRTEGVGVRVDKTGLLDRLVSHESLSKNFYFNMGER